MTFVDEYKVQVEIDQRDFDLELVSDQIQNADIEQREEHVSIVVRDINTDQYFRAMLVVGINDRSWERVQQVTFYRCYPKMIEVRVFTSQPQ